MDVNLKLNMRSRVMRIVVLGIVCGIGSALVACPNGKFCDSDETCCAFFQKPGYGCCPYKDAVCCYPNETCCPHANKCANEGRCVESATLPQLLFKTS